MDREIGFVLGIHLGRRDQCLEHTAAQAAAEGMLQIGFRPKVLHFVDHAMRDAFAPVAQRLDICVTGGEELAMLLEAMRGIMAGNGRLPF